MAQTDGNGSDSLAQDTSACTIRFRRFWAVAVLETRHHSKVLAELRWLEETGAQIRLRDDTTAVLGAMAAAAALGIPI